MSPFAEFREKNGPPADCREAPRATVQRFRETLPAPLIDEWEEVGWCTYADGLIWLVDPTALEDVLEDWFEPSWAGIPFGRTAFGDLFLWREEEVQYLHVHYGEVGRLSDNVDLFFNSSLCSDRYLDTVLWRDLYREALPRLGRPEADECYAFEPALALGGEPTASALRKVKLREHLGILAQLVLEAPLGEP